MIIEAHPHELCAVCGHSKSNHDPNDSGCNNCDCTGFNRIAPTRDEFQPCQACGHWRSFHSLPSWKCTNCFICPGFTGIVKGTGSDPVEAAVENLLTVLGLDTKSEGLRETPRRVAGYLHEFTQPFEPGEILKDGFENPTGATGAMVVQEGIPFRGCCEHHLLPFHGTANIGYVPSKRVVGLSKLTRLVQAVGTRKPSTQEEITNSIVDFLDTHVEPLGVMVVTKAIHTCMAVRGVNAPGVTTKVSAIRGIFRDVPTARQEFFSLVDSR